MGVVILDKEEIKELLYEELSLTNEIKKFKSNLAIFPTTWKYWPKS